MVICYSGFTLVSGQCVNLNTDPANCGAPGVAVPTGNPPLNGQRVCQGGAVTVVCYSGFTAANGQCANLNIDPANCGAPGVAVPTGNPPVNGQRVCQGGAVTVVCYSGFTLAGGQCVNLNTDPANCGTPGTALQISPQNGQRVCQTGVSTVICYSGFTLAGGQCVNLNTDPANCGTPGTALQISPQNGQRVCQTGVSTVICYSGFTLAGGQCVNLNTDPANCGSPGTVVPNVANATSGCAGGVSVILSCNPGYANADLVFPNGCEVPNNNAFASGAAAGSLPLTFISNTVNATVEAGEPAPTCAGAGGHSVWYTFTPTVTATVQADTLTSDFDTVIAVYTGSSINALTSVGCNDQFGGNQSLLQFSATAGVTYHIQVESWNITPGGNLVFHLFHL